MVAEKEKQAGDERNEEDDHRNSNGKELLRDSRGHGDGGAAKKGRAMTGRGNSEEHAPSIPRCRRELPRYACVRNTHWVTTPNELSRAGGAMSTENV